MNCWTRIALVVTWLLVTIGVTGWADTTATHFTVKGETAVATFQAMNPQDPCIENFVSVTASDLMEKLSPGGGPTATVRTLLIVGQVDVCLGVTLFSGQGETPEQAFQFASDLRSATLQTTVPVFDFTTATVYDFTVDLRWTAVGEATTENLKETFEDEDLGIRIVSHLRGTHADAEAAGTVMGIGQNVTPEPSVDAMLSRENNGTIIVEMTP